MQDELSGKLDFEVREKIIRFLTLINDGNAKYGNFIKYLMSEFGEDNLEIVLKLLEKYEIEDIKLLLKSQNLAFIKQNIS